MYRPNKPSPTKSDSEQISKKIAVSYTIGSATVKNDAALLKLSGRFVARMVRNTLRRYVRSPPRPLRPPPFRSQEMLEWQFKQVERA